MKQSARLLNSRCVLKSLGFDVAANSAHQSMLQVLKRLIDFTLKVVQVVLAILIYWVYLSLKV